MCSHTHTQRFFRGYKNITRPVRQSLPLLPLTLLCCVCVCAGQMAATTQQSAHTAVFFLFPIWGKPSCAPPYRPRRVLRTYQLGTAAAEAAAGTAAQGGTWESRRFSHGGGETRSGWAIWVALNFFEIYITARPSCVCVCVQMARSISQLNFLADYIDNSDDCCWAPSPRQMRLHTPPHPPGYLFICIPNNFI